MGDAPQLSTQPSYQGNTESSIKGEHLFQFLRELVVRRVGMQVADCWRVVCMMAQPDTLSVNVLLIQLT
jgi:hypothetical protein